MPDISPQMMDMMKQQQGGAQQPPVSAPMSTPQPNEGEKQGAMAQVQMATKILEQTLAAFGSGSDEGKAVLEALTKLNKSFGESSDKGRDLIPSEVMNMVGSLPQSSQAQMQPPGGGQQQPPMQ